MYMFITKIKMLTVYIILECRLVNGSWRLTILSVSLNVDDSRAAGVHFTTTYFSRETIYQHKLSVQQRYHL